MDIVTKSAKGPVFTAFQVTPFEKPGPGERMRFEVNLVAEALDGMRKQAVVEPNLPTWSPFSIVCDEGTALGGTDEAPPPLGYLSAGIAFCLLTHISSFIRQKKLDVRSVRVEQRVNFSTTLVTDAEKKGVFNGACEGVETHVLVDTDESPDVVRDLVRCAEDACMAMQAIMNATPTNTQVHVNNEALETL